MRLLLRTFVAPSLQFNLEDSVPSLGVFSDVLVRLEALLGIPVGKYVMLSLDLMDSSDFL